MATTKFDPYRKTGGTIELVRDSKTGAYSTKTVGFADLPVFNLPKLGIVEVTDDAATTKKKADEALKTQTSAAFQSGGGGGGGGEDRNRFLLPVDDGAEKTSKLLTSTFDVMKEDETAADRGIGIKTPEIKTPEVFMGEFAGTGPDRGADDEGVFVGDESAVELGEMRTTTPSTDTSKVPSRNDLTNIQRRQLAKDRNINIGGVTYTASQIDKATIDRGAAFPDDPFGEFGAQVGTTPILGEFAGTGPDRGNQTLGISADPTGATAVTQSQGPFDPRFRDQAVSLGISAEPSDTKLAKEADFASGIPEKRNIFEKAIDSFKDGSASLKIAQTGLMIGGQILNQIGDAVLGVTAVDKRRRELDSAAAKSLGFKTRGELGASVDPGRIAFSPADHVLGGKNRDSALGNLSESGAKRIQTRMTVGQARVDKKYGANSKQAQDFREKTKTFQRQMNEFNTEKEKKRKEKAQNPNLRSGAGKEGGGTSGGKIVCTMMNESYGFGSFRNKIWLRQSKNLAPEYQKGYHRIFLPLVKYAKQKGTTNKIIKNILEHIAIHRTIDIRQEERNKIHLIGRIYRKILEPICYWAGKK